MNASELIQRFNLYVALHYLSENLKLAGALAHAYSKGEADAWYDAERYYKGGLMRDYNEGYEAGYDAGYRRRISEQR